MNRILPILAILIAIGAFFLYVNPTWTVDIAAVQASIASDDQALAAASQYNTQQSTLTDARNQIDPASLARLNVFLPDSVDNVGLILDLTTLASHSGLSLSNIDVTTNIPAMSQAAGAPGALPAAGKSPLGSVDMSLTAVGTYTALQTFLTGVEKSERLLDVRDLTVKGADTGIYTYQMILRLYWLR